MNKRLKYERVNNSNDVISIDLYNGYYIIAMSGFNKETEKYTTTLFLKDNGIDTLRMVVENIEFAATYKTINSAILKYVSDALDRGTIDKYIESFVFEQECTERGIEIVEKELYGEE